MKATSIFKRIFYGIIISTIMSVIISCNDKLDLNPPDQFALGNFWTNETNAMIALVGVYRGGVA